MGIKILFAILLSISLYAEPSVYSRATTYKSSNSSNAIYRLQQQVATLKEEVEGLKSLVESLSTQINRINSIKSPNRDDSSNKNDAKINMLLSRVEKLEDVVRDINKRMVSSITNASPLPKKEKPKRVVSSSHTINNKTSNYKLYKKGVILFDRKRYSDAKSIFETLLKRGYKKAATNFYLGEIAYRTGRYRDAIKYYQESAELDDDAAYMDRLLLHTGISLEKDGDKQQAKRFYEAIIDGYPNTSSARIAKKRLK